jgi:hypothetical protein
VREGFTDWTQGAAAEMAGSSLRVVHLASLLAAGFLLGSVQASQGDVDPHYR